MRKVAIHMGLNAVDATHYNGWNGTLMSCENDAHDMANITMFNQFNATLLLAQQATSERLLRLLSDQANQMVSGDKLILTFSGHGTRIRDVSGDEKDDRLDEAWVLYDRLLIDDELYNAFARFRLGVSLFVVLDSCHSGTAIRLMQQESRPRRFLPAQMAMMVYRTHSQRYSRALSAIPRTTLNDLKCSAILLSACKDNQYAIDGEKNGFFTGTLKRVWGGGRFFGDNLSFVQKIQKNMPSYQTPGLFSLGLRAAQLQLERPFLI